MTAGLLPLDGVKQCANFASREEEGRDVDR